MVDMVVNYMTSPDNDGVTFEEIRDIVWQRHNTERIGDSDTM